MGKWVLPIQRVKKTKLKSPTKTQLTVKKQYVAPKVIHVEFKTEAGFSTSNDPLIPIETLNIDVRNSGYSTENGWDASSMFQRNF